MRISLILLNALISVHASTSADASVATPGPAAPATATAASTPTSRIDAPMPPEQACELKRKLALSTAESLAETLDGLRRKREELARIGTEEGARQLRELDEAYCATLDRTRAGLVKLGEGFAPKAECADKEAQRRLSAVRAGLGKRDRESGIDCAKTPRSE